LYGGSIRFTVPMMFALAFLPMFGIGGLTGLPLGLAATDIPLHDTYYVVGHFHYVVAPGTLFALFAGIYFWFPRITGKKLNDGLGQIHFWGSLVGMNGIFLPMLIQGLAGVNRRLYDGGLSYPHAAGFAHLNTGQFYSAVFLGVIQLAFIGNFVWTLMKKRRDADPDPWRATTLEWALRLAPLAQGGRPKTVAHVPIPFTTTARHDTGVTNVTMGFWLFLASEVMLFGALFSAYALLRVSADSWPHGREVLNSTLAIGNTVLLLAASVAAWLASRSGTVQRTGYLWISMVCAVCFTGVKIVEFHSEAVAGMLPRTSTFFATYFTLTGLHAVHVIGAVIAAIWILAAERRAGDAMTAGRARCLALYWGFVELVWLAILGTVYFS
jgi:heme/copper-type cytochrome/quinol oxidase subunit 3